METVVLVLVAMETILIISNDDNDTRGPKGIIHADEFLGDVCHDTFFKDPLFRDRSANRCCAWPKDPGAGGDGNNEDDDDNMRGPRGDIIKDDNGFLSNVGEDAHINDRNGYFAGGKDPDGSVGDALHDDEDPNRRRPTKRRPREDNNIILDSDHKEALPPAAYTNQHNMFLNAKINHGNTFKTQQRADNKEAVAADRPHLIIPPLPTQITMNWAYW